MALELLIRGHFKELKGPFIVIFPALNPASLVHTISLSTPFVLPIDAKGLSDLCLVTATTLHSNLLDFFPTRISSILKVSIFLRSNILRMHSNIGLSW